MGASCLSTWWPWQRDQVCHKERENCTQETLLELLLLVTVNRCEILGLLCGEIWRSIPEKLILGQGFLEAMWPSGEGHWVPGQAATIIPWAKTINRSWRTGANDKSPGTNDKSLSANEKSLVASKSLATNGKSHRTRRSIATATTKAARYLAWCIVSSKISIKYRRYFAIITIFVDFRLYYLYNTGYNS